MSSKEIFEKAEQLRVEEKLDEAIAAYMEVSKKAEGEKEFWLMAESIHMIGLIHLQRKELDMAEHCLESARHLFQKQNDLNMVGAVLRDLSSVFMELEDLDTAEKDLKESISLLEKGDLIGHLGISKVRLGRLLGQKKDFEKGIALIQEGISDIERSDDRFFESSAYYSLAKVYKEQEKRDLARQSAEQALSILEEIASGDLYKNRKNEIKKFIEELT